MKLYIGWLDLGPRRKGRAWMLHATPNPDELSPPPFILARIA